MKNSPEAIFWYLLVPIWALVAVDYLAAYIRRIVRRNRKESYK